MLVEDHAVVRQGLIALLGSSPEIEVVGWAADGSQAVQLFAELAPDVTLMDLQMPKLGGVEAITRIRAVEPAARFIVLTTYDGDEDIYRAMHAGAKAYLLKGMDIEELMAAIRAVYHGKALVPSAIAQKLAGRVHGQQLTARELSVLERIVAGRSNKEIGVDLCISEATVKSHVNSLLAKLSVEDRTQAAVIALQRGFARLP